MNNRLKGIIYILISALGFSFMNLFIRLAGDLPTIQKSFFRNIIAFALAFAILLRENKKNPVKELNNWKDLPWKTLLMRAAFGTTGIFCNYYALDHLLLSDASVLNKLAPFATLIFSAIFLKEKLKKNHIYAIILAFIGVILVVRPSLEFKSVFPYLIGIGGGIFAGAAYTCVRQLSKKGVSSSFIVAFFSLFSSLTCIPYLITNFQKMSLYQSLILLAVGLSALVGQFGVTLAYKNAPASEISVFDYTTICFTGILGFIFLKQSPDLISFLGYLIIFLGGYMNFMTNKKALNKKMS